MAATDTSRPAVLGGPAVVLVRPQLGENIGAAARAMLNFGLTELRLVAPRDGWPSEQARAAASRADLVLDRATVHATTADAIADLNLVLATTARARDMAKPVLRPREAAARLRQALARGEKAGILFGAERAGLHNDDIAPASAIVEVATNPAFSSLNLAQAVLLMGHEWFQADPAAEAPPSGAARASAAELANFHRRLEAGLDAGGFLKPPEKRPAMTRNIRNMFARAGFSEAEVRTLHGIVSALRRAGPAPEQEAANRPDGEV